jgi:hypothetical protein
MQVDSTGGQGLTLPLQFVFPSSRGEFASRARVLFRSEGQPGVVDGNYVFEEQTLEYRPETLNLPDAGKSLAIQEVPLPIFSFAALVLLIVFRNVFYNAFLKYFLSIRNNYEIDFNVQKIGVPPLLTAMLIIVLALADYLNSAASSDVLHSFVKTIQMIFFPMAISTIALFLFSLSLRFFPVIFPDIKVLFFIAVLLLVYNCALYGLQGRIPIEMQFLLPFLVLLFFALRSFFLFMVFRKFFRYRSALSLFYICALNLSTCLVLYEILK